MTTEQFEAFVNEALRDTDFDFDNPNPALAWEVFKKVSSKPVDCDSDYLFFEAAEGDEQRGYEGYFDFVREFQLCDPEDESIVFHQQLTLHFTNQPSDRSGIASVYVSTTDFPDRMSFFRAVEHLPEFRKGLNFGRWSFEVRLDGC